MAQVLTSVEPESEKFALSPTADLDEIREFLRCESLERMQLCMRLQKQQELLERLSDTLGEDGFHHLTPLKDVGSNEDPRTLRVGGGGRKQLYVEVDALKRSVENLTQDVKDLQESLDPVDGCRMEPSNSLVISRNDGKVQDDYPEDREGELDRSYKVAGSDVAESPEFEGVYEPALDLQWLDERFEEVQRQCLSELSHLEERLMDDYGNLKGFVDAAIVAMVSRMSTLEIFVKGEGGLLEKMEELKQVPEDSSPQRLKGLEDQMNEANERLTGLEKRVTGLSERPTVAFSPATACRPIQPRGVLAGVETADSVVAEKHEAALSPQRVLSHGPVLRPAGVGTPVVNQGSLKVPAPSWGSPVQPVFRLAGASSSQLVTVLATPRPSSPTREVRNPALVSPLGSPLPAGVTAVPQGRSATPLRHAEKSVYPVASVPVVRAPTVRF